MYISIFQRAKLKKNYLNLINLSQAHSKEKMENSNIVNYQTQLKIEKENTHNKIDNKNSTYYYKRIGKNRVYNVVNNSYIIINENIKLASPNSNKIFQKKKDFKKQNINIRYNYNEKKDSYFNNNNLYNSPIKYNNKYNKFIYDEKED